MAGRKVQHWKHGWIPVSPEAKAYVAGKGPRPVTGRVRKSPQTDDIGAVLGRLADDPKVKARISEAEALERATTAYERRRARQRAVGIQTSEITDGVQFDTYEPGRDTLEIAAAQDHPHQFTKGQQREIARTVNEVRVRFPKLQPIRIVGDRDEERFGVTEWDGRRITLSGIMYEPDQIEGSRRNFGEHGSIVAQYADDDEFRRATIVHELGHALQMQDDRARALGESYAERRVTPRDIGEGDLEDWARKIDPNYEPVPAPRWRVDTLNHQTNYGLANKWEWFAEAFAEGYLHGDKATPQGKGAVELMHQIYGGEGDGTT